MEVVVVLPWVPVTTTGIFSRRKKAFTSFRERNKGKSEIQHILNFRVAARERVSHHDQVGFGLQVFGIIALRYLDLLLHKEITHRGINPLVGTGDFIAALFQHGCERSHPGPAYSDQMNPMNRISPHSARMYQNREDRPTELGMRLRVYGFTGSRGHALKLNP